MKTTTIKIATNFTAAIKAGVTGIVSVISAAESSRLRWRFDGRDGNPGVVGQRLAALAHLLAMRHASPAMATNCRPSGDALMGRRPRYSVASQLASI